MIIVSICSVVAACVPIPVKIQNAQYKWSIISGHFSILNFVFGYAVFFNWNKTLELVVPFQENTIDIEVDIIVVTLSSLQFPSSSRRIGIIHLIYIMMYHKTQMGTLTRA